MMQKHAFSTDHLAPQATVTAARLVRNFGEIRNETQQRPVFVTHHGKVTNVLLSASGFETLRSVVREDFQENADVQLPSLQTFAGWIQQGVIIIDQDFTIVVANSTIHVMGGHDAGSLIGRNLFSVIPELHGSLAKSYIIRAIAIKEGCGADIPSIFRPDAKMRIDVFPLAHNTTIVFDDLTEYGSNDLRANSNGASASTTHLNRNIGWMHLNRRGYVEAVDQSLVQLLKLSTDRLTIILAVDLVSVADRLKFRHALDSVLCGNGRQCLNCTFVSNDGSIIDVQVSIENLHGYYGSEGVALVVTRH